MRTINPSIDDDALPCLSLWQPWASLLVWPAQEQPENLPPKLPPAIAEKRHETRSWRTDYRGPVLVHASVKWNTDLAQLCLGDPFRDVIERHLGLNPGTLCRGNAGRLLKDTLPFGAIVGVTHLSGCTSTNDDQFQDWDFLVSNDHYFGDYDPDRFAWRTHHPQWFKTPIPYCGRQGWFSVPLKLVPEYRAI
jgi:activating signal cointegrator 1